MTKPNIKTKTNTKNNTKTKGMKGTIKPVKYNLTHIQVDPIYCLTPGLFRSLQRGERKRSKLDITYVFGNGKKVEFSGSEPLGANDLRILQGLTAMAGVDGLILNTEPKTAAGKELRKALDLKWDAINEKAIMVKGSYRALAKEVGYANIDDTKLIRDCIERLWKVLVIVDDGNGKRMGFHLLSNYASDEVTGNLCVALNPLLVSAILGNGQYVRINMDEVRALNSDVVRLLHQRLCAWINFGKSGRVEIDTLCSYVYPDITTNLSTIKKRRQTVKKALVELISIGWIVEEYSKNKFEVKRPKPLF